jgi:uncharacterized protein
MELSNEFEVAVPLEEAWAVLTDVERIAPCMPGAELREVEGDEYRGIVKVKVGPITASYRGAARFEQLDQAAHRAVLKAEGRETRGQGNATAVITATLVPAGSGTKVSVETDLAITGKVAQFGRGVLADVSAKLLDQFVQNLETTVLAPSTKPEAARSAAEGSGSAPAKPGGDDGAGNGSGGAHDGSSSTAARSSSRRSRGRRTGSGSGGEEEAAGSGSGEPPASSSETAAGEPSGGGAAGGARQIDAAPAVPVDLVEVAGPSLLKRLAPFMTVAGVLLILRIVVYSLRRRRR